MEKSNDFKEAMLEFLRSGPVDVVFTKLDGTERKMKCTLDMDLIPEHMRPSGNGSEKSDTVVCVFDVEKQAWRSFRRDSVKSFTITMV